MAAGPLDCPKYTHTANLINPFFSEYLNPYLPQRPLANVVSNNPMENNCSKIMFHTPVYLLIFAPDHINKSKVKQRIILNEESFERFQ